MTPPGTAEIPEGFARHLRKSGLTEPWEPLYSRTQDDAVTLGLRAGPAHANSRGFVHGGLIAALADNAMGLSCALGGDGAALVTVSLSMDYVAAARSGSWLQWTPAVTKRGRVLSFAQCLVTADGAPCARGTAIFNAPARPA